MCVGPEPEVEKEPSIEVDLFLEVETDRAGIDPVATPIGLGGCIDGGQARHREVIAYCGDVAMRAEIALDADCSIRSEGRREGVLVATRVIEGRSAESGPITLLDSSIDEGRAEGHQVGISGIDDIGPDQESVPEVRGRKVVEEDAHRVSRRVESDLIGPDLIGCNGHTLGTSDESILPDPAGARSIGRGPEFPSGHRTLARESEVLARCDTFIRADGVEPRFVLGYDPLLIL